MSARFRRKMSVLKPKLVVHFVKAVAPEWVRPLRTNCELLVTRCLDWVIIKATSESHNSA